MKRLTEDELLALWLAAEDDADLSALSDLGPSERELADRRAEAALTALFASLPRSAPAPGFAERVIVRTLPARAPRFLPAFLTSPWGRAVAVLGVVLAAVGLPLAFHAALSILVAVRPDALAPVALFAARLLTDIGGGLLSVLRLGHWLATLAGALTQPLRSPAVAAVSGLCLLVSALALGLLRVLFQRERNWSHVHPA